MNLNESSGLNIKPWPNLVDHYTPHIDHLFDKGYISFKDNGDVIIGELISKEVLVAWFIDTKNVGAFNTKQREYLNYHREVVLKRGT